MKCLVNFTLHKHTSSIFLIQIEITLVTGAVLNAQNNIQVTFKDLQEGELMAYLGKLHQCFITCTTQQCCQVHKEPALLQFVPIAFGPDTGNRWKESSSLHLPFRYLQTLRSSPEPSAG